MQHEVLLACLGHPGNIIVKKNEQEGFVVEEGFPFLSEAETDGINRIVKLGFFFSKLQEFIETTGPNYRAKWQANNKEVRGGSLYRRALGLGLKRELQRYRCDVAAMEHKLSEDPRLPLSYLHQGLREYHMILPPLVAFCHKVQSQNLQGAHILELLHTHAVEGLPVVKLVFERLMKVCNQVLFNQMISWMLHGVLTDPFAEFFIQPTLLSQGQSVNGGAGVDSGLALGWHSEFTVRLSCLPTTFLPSRLAQKVLFVGKAVRVLRLTAQRKEMISATNRWLGTKEKQEPDSERGSIDTEVLALSEEELEHHMSMWQDLKGRPTFHLMSVEHAVDQIHEIVAQRLWNLMVVQAKLPKHLGIIKRYFLLEKGDFFSSFIEESRDMMMKAPNSRSVSDLNLGPFQQCGRVCNVPDEEMQKMKIYLELPNFEKHDFTTIQGFLLVGDATIRPESGKIVLCNSAPTKHNTQHRSQWRQGIGSGAGGIWYKHRKEVQQGFSTRVAFQFVKSSSESEVPSGLSFCLQNLRLDALGNHSNKSFGVGGIPNSISLRLSLTSPKQELSLWRVPRTAGASEDMDICLGSLELPTMLEPDHMHHFDIEYRPSREASDCELLISINQKNINYSNDNLKFQVSLPTAMQVEGAGAYIGVIAAGDSMISLVEWDYTSHTSVKASSSIQNSLMNRRLENQNLWLGLQLEYTIDWPLHLILTQEVLQQYNKVFSFLFYVKRVQYELEQIWPQLMQTKYRRKEVEEEDGLSDDESSQIETLPGSPNARQNLAPLWKLRAWMSFFVQNLQYYLQVDVIEAQYEQLVQSLDQAKDFNSIRKAHTWYLQIIRTKCYLDMGTVKRSLHRLLQLCMGFCALVNAYEDPHQVPVFKISDLMKEFHEESNLLFVMLERADAKELVMRLDFNGLYSESTRTLH